MRRGLLAVSLSVGALAVTATPSAAVVTVGQVGTPTLACGSPVEVVQPTVTSGNSYAAPASGRIISWSTQAAAQTGPMKLKVYRPVSGVTNSFTVIGQDVPRTITPNTLNTFTLSPGITIQSGDLVGLGSPTGVTDCGFAVPGETRQSSFTDTANGGTLTTTPNAGFRINISAVLDPTNTVQIGDISRNKKKGNATLAVTVPNPGGLSVSGKGVKASDATAGAAGEVDLKIRAKGKKKNRLNDNGKVKVTPQITFTPTGGTAGTSSTKVKLRKN